MDADPAPEIPRLLPVRLSRVTPPVGCAFVLGAFMTAVAVGAYFLGQKTRAVEKDGWILYVFAGVFGFFGLLVLWSWFRQILMARTPVPIVEISAQPFHAGESARIALIQCGPAKLRSLRANLVCLEQHITWRERSSGSDGGSSYRKVDEKMIHTQNLISVPFVLAPAGGDWHTIQEFTIPADARPSEETETHAILWRIELWGKGPILASYMHPFPLKSSQHRRRFISGS